jgi:hypothetical protein
MDLKIDFKSYYKTQAIRPKSIHSESEMVAISKWYREWLQMAEALAAL